MSRPIRRTMEESFLDDPPQLLHLAACKGDIVTLTHLLESRLDFDEESFWRTPLHVAIRCNEVEAVRILLKAGADLEALFPCNLAICSDPVSNPIRLAVLCGYREIFQMLWDGGRTRKSRRSRNFDSSLLSDAASEDYPDIVHDLLGLLDEWTQEEKEGALLSAASAWSADTVQALLVSTKFEGDILRRSLEGCMRGGPKSFDTLIYIATWTMEESTKQAKTIEYLVNVYPEADTTMLLHYTAMRPSCVQALRYLLRAGTDPNVDIDDWGTTALHIAVKMQGWGTINKAGADELIRCGADVNCPDLEGKTPLHWAFELGGDVEIVKMLVNAGANPAAADNNAITPMIGAAYMPFYGDEQSEKSQVEMLKILLEVELRSIDWEDDDGKNVRKWASMHGWSDNWQEW